MVNRENYLYLANRAASLQFGSKFSNSRTLRRMLSEVVMDSPADESRSELFQSFAFEEGYNADQLVALVAHAEEVSAMNRRTFEVLGLQAEIKPVLFDADFGLVSVQYVFACGIATATLAELQNTVRVVQEIASSMAVFGRNPNEDVLKDCPRYAYRNLPCSIAPYQHLWCVSGDDVAGTSGVLEWCYDEADAVHTMAKMTRFPLRFKGLKAHALRDCAYVSFV